MSEAKPIKGRQQFIGAKPNKDTKKVFGRLLKELWHTGPVWLIVIVLCIAGSAILSSTATSMLSTVINNINNGNSWQELVKNTLIMASLFLSAIIITTLYNQIIVRVAQKLLKRYRDQMFSKMQSFPIKYFDTHKHGDIMSRYTNDADTLRQLISQSIPSIVSSCCTIISVFAFLIYYSWILTLIVIAFIVVMFFITKRLGGKSRQYFIAQQQSVGAVNGYVEEMISGQKVIKVFNHQDISKQEFGTLNNQLCNNATSANKIANTFMPIMMQLGNLQYVVLAVVGSIMAIYGFMGMNIGAIVAFLTFSKTFNQAISQVTNQMNSIIMALAGAGRIYELLDTKPEEDNGYVTLVNIKTENGELCETTERTGAWAWKHPHSDGSVSYIPLKGEVVLENVNFSYNKGEPVLKDVSLCAKNGQKIAFVGATGAGKTTITNLINRFYDLDSGKIRYDGINISKIKKPDLRRSLGMVLQDVNLFSDTVIENIRYGNLDATDEQCVDAAKLAGAHNFIEMLPKGYNTVLEGDGSGLSQGQRQLISIARAAVCNPPVMILDEATSSIDTRTESLIQKGMDALMEGRTVFVIAHRLSTIQNADQIIVLDKGKIAELGTHKELLEQKSLYYRLYTGVFELE